MSEPDRDRWAEWVLHRQHGEDDIKHTSESEFLRSLRDWILDNAKISEGETLLDVGAGDGLLAFGALDRIGERGQVIFSDVSQDLLDHCQILAEKADVLGKCRFVQASADDLGVLGDASVDVVTTRSVLIYVDDKCRAFEEFHRVLKPGGRLSIFEPINSFNRSGWSNSFVGYDVEPVLDLADKVRTVYEKLQPPNTDPMLNFGERDLFNLAEAAGFDEIHLTFGARVKTGNPYDEEPMSWDAFLKISGNPKIPTVEEAMDEALTPEERECFADHLRPLVENGRQRWPVASACLLAVKSVEEQS